MHSTTTTTSQLGIEIPVGPAHVRVCPPARHDARRPTVIAIDGEIDASNIHDISALTQEILSAQSDVVIDLSDVTFMAARGLSTLTELPERARSHGIGCAVVTSPAIDHLLDVVDRQRPVWVYYTADSALDAVEVEGLWRNY